MNKEHAENSGVIISWAAGPSVRARAKTEGSFLSSDLTRGGLPMVTYSDLIQVGILIVGICSLIVQIIRLYKKK